MVRRCFVPNCKSGYKSESRNGKVSMFKAPKDEILLKKWARAIKRSDRPLTEKHYVCAKHFAKHLIKTDWTAMVGDIEVRATKKIPKLEADAVPTIFLGCLDKELPRKRKCENINREISEPEKLADESSTTTNNNNDNTIQIKSELPHDDSDSLTNYLIDAEEEHIEVQADININIEPAECLERVELEPQGNQIVENKLNFEGLWQLQENEIKLPSDSWCIHKINNRRDQTGCRCVTFTEMRKLFKQPVPVVCKQLWFDEEGLSEPNFALFGRPIPVPDFGSALRLDESEFSKVQRLEEALMDFEKVRVCNGGPRETSYKNINPECATVDPVCGAWRHRDCTVSTLSAPCGYSCHKCSTLDRILNVHLVRKIQRGNEPLKRIRIVTGTGNYSPEKVELLRKAHKAKAQNESRLKKRVSLLQEKVKYLETLLRKP